MVQELHMAEHIYSQEVERCECPARFLLSTLSIILVHAGHIKSDITNLASTLLIDSFDSIVIVNPVMMTIKISNHIQ